MANDYLCRFVKKKADFHSEKRYKIGTGNDKRIITFLWWVNLEWPTV